MWCDKGNRLGLGKVLLFYDNRRGGVNKNSCRGEGMLLSPQHLMFRTGFPPQSLLDPCGQGRQLCRDRLDMGVFVHQRLDGRREFPGAGRRGLALDSGKRPGSARENDGGHAGKQGLFLHFGRVMAAGQILDQAGSRAAQSARGIRGWQDSRGAPSPSGAWACQRSWRACRNTARSRPGAGPGWGSRRW